MHVILNKAMQLFFHDKSNGFNLMASVHMIAYLLIE